MISIGNLQINKLCLGNLEVAKAYVGDVQVYGSTPQPVEKYMTMTVLDGTEGTVISPKITGSIQNLNLQYRINNGDWNNFIVGTTADIHVVSGDVVNWKGVNESGISNSSSNYLNFAISGNPVALSGNVMSLIDGVGDALVIPRNYCFYYLFSNSNVKTVSSDFLPATTLTPYCYRSMFRGCKSLTTAPELPATTLENYCYEYMFSGCTSLTTAPALPATTLADSCYSDMFYECKSLVNAPVLPATTLANGCYGSMFRLCTSLTTAPELPATTLTDNCYSNMFSGDSKLNYVKSLATDISARRALNNWLYMVSSTGTFVKPAGVSYTTGASGIPQGWTIQNI